MLLILEEHDLENYVKEEVAELEGDEEKARHKKNMVKAKRIVVDSIKNHFIPHVSSLKTPKELFDGLTGLCEGRNMNQKMTLRTQLKNVKMQISKTIQSHFTRVAQIKVQLKAIGNQIEEEKMGEDNNQALTAHAKKEKSKKEEHSHEKPRRFQKDYSNYKCYTCDEKGHLTRDCPKGNGHVKKGKKKRYHAHTT